MKVVNQNNASRLLAKVKAYTDRKAQEVDLRAGGTIKGNLRLDGLSTDTLCVNGFTELNGIVSFGSDIDGDVTVNGTIYSYGVESNEVGKWSIDYEGGAIFSNLTVGSINVREGSTFKGSIRLDGSRTSFADRPTLMFHIPNTGYCKFVMDDTAMLHLIDGSSNNFAGYKPLKAKAFYGESAEMSLITADRIEISDTATFRGEANFNNPVKMVTAEIMGSLAVAGINVKDSVQALAFGFTKRDGTLAASIYYDETSNKILSTVPIEVVPAA